MKKLNTLLLAAALAVSTIVSVSALELAAPETADEYTAATSSAVLAEDYGTLVYQNTYDSASEITSKAIPVISAGIGTTNTAGTLYDWGYGASYSLETPSGLSSPMVKVTGTGAYVPAAYVNGTINVPGTYTMMVDYYIPAQTGNATMDYGFGGLKNGSNGVQFKEVYGTKGALSTFTLSYELAEGSSIGGMYIASAYGSCTTYYIDNFRLYYKAPAPAAITATVYTSVAKTTAFATYADLAAGATVTLPNARAFAANTPSGSYLNGFGIGNTTYAPGAVYTVTADDLAAGALAIVPIFGTIGKPGALIYENTFDTTVNGYLHAAENFVGTADSSNVYNWGTGGSFSVETPTGMSSPMMKITPSNGIANTQAAWINMKLTAPGTYTFDFDYFCPTSTNTDGRVIRYGFSEKATEAYFTKGALTHVTYEAPLASGSTFTAMYVMMRYGSNYTTSDVFYLDNFRLYYTPARPAVSVHVLDAEGNVSVDTNAASGATVTLPTAMPKDGAILTGFTCGGTSYAPGASYTVTAADAMTGFLDFTPVYRTVTPTHPADGELILQENFEGIADDTVIFNDAGSGGILTAYKNGYIATPNLSENEAFAGKAFCFTRGSALNTSYVTTASGVKGVAVAQPVNGSSRFPVFGLAGGSSNSNESLALTEDGVYTVYADFGLRADDLANIKRVFIQVSYTDGSTESFDVYDGLTAASLNTVKAEATVENDRGIKMVAFAAETKTAGDNIVFMVDNIELYYAKGTATVSDGDNSIDILYKPGAPFALPTYEDLGYEPVFTCGGKTFYGGDKITVTDATVSVTAAALDVLTVNKAQFRTASGTKAGGIRFASFIANEVKENASEYGFIIAREDSFTDGDYAPLAFPAAFTADGTTGSGTLTAGGAFVYGVCYNKANGTELTYATDDEVFGGDLGYEDRYTDGGCYFCGVLTGMTGYAQYSTDIVARPFAVIGGVNVYGKPVVRNLYDMACAYQEQIGAGTDAYVDGIVASAR